MNLLVFDNLRMVSVITLRIIGRNTEHSFRSAIGISLIVAMIVSLFSLLAGFSSELAGLTSQAGSSSYIIISDETSPSFSSSQLPYSTVELLETISNVEQVFPQVILPISVSIANITTTLETFLWGVNISKLLEFKPDTLLKSGEIPASNYNASNDTVCLAGMTFESITGLQLSGDTILSGMIRDMSTNVSLKVTGVLYERGMHHDGLITWIEDAWKLYPPLVNKCSVIEIKLKSPVMAFKTKKEIEQKLQQEGLAVNVEFEKKNTEFMDSLFGEIIDKLDYLVTALFVIILLKVFHSTSWLLMQHERDLMLLRILGFSRWSVSFSAILISLVIGNLGFIAGTIFGLLAPLMLISGLNVVMDLVSISFIITEVDLLKVFVLSNVAMVVGSVYPLVKLVRKPLIIPPTTNEIGLR
ncbi:MAG: FtsX-like permease family protein [Candidatus Odinarchaeota archaeon]